MIYFIYKRVRWVFFKYSFFHVFAYTTSQGGHVMVMVMKYTVLIVIFLALYRKVWTLLKLLSSVRSDKQLP